MVNYIARTNINNISFKGYIKGPDKTEFKKVDKYLDSTVVSNLSYFIRNNLTNENQILEKSLPCEENGYEALIKFTLSNKEFNFIQGTKLNKDNLNSSEKRECTVETGPEKIRLTYTYPDGKEYIWERRKDEGLKAYNEMLRMRPSPLCSPAQLEAFNNSYNNMKKQAEEEKEHLDESYEQLRKILNEAIAEGMPLQPVEPKRQLYPGYFFCSTYIPPDGIIPRCSILESCGKCPSTEE